MISRRALVTSAAVLLAGAAVEGCAGKGIGRLFKGKSTRGYQGTGTRIPVLANNQALDPSPALKGVDFAIPAPQAQPNWPVPGGVYDGAVDHVDAAKDFEVAWRRDVGAGGSRRSHPTGAPVILDGVIYVMDGKATVSALDEQSGATLWRTNLETRSRRDREGYGGGVAIADGLVFVSSGYRFVAALDPKTGEVKWRTAMATPVHSAPTCGGGRVFVTDVTDQFYALDAQTGAINWDYQALEEPARMRTASSAVVSGDVVVAPFASGEVVAMRVPNGAVLWSDTLSFTNRNNALSEIRDIPGRPVVYRGDVFAGSHSGMFGSIALRDGRRRWDLPITTITTPWPAGDVVYVVDQSGQVICVARESGQIYWKVNLNEGIRKVKKRPVWSSPILASNRLILSNNKGLTVALNPKTGEKIGQLKLGAAGYIGPVAANGRIYILNDDAQLVAIR
jgi:outer membrane protein assembly factor BamB